MIDRMFVIWSYLDSLKFSILDLISVFSTDFQIDKLLLILRGISVWGSVFYLFP